MSIRIVDLADTVLDVRRDFSITPRKREPGKIERVEGITIGYVESVHGFPHDGERHPDGDEVLLLISGHLRVAADGLSEPVDLLPGSACLVPKGEWHKVHVVEPSRFFFVTPGPHSEHRPLSDEALAAWRAKMSAEKPRRSV